MLPNYLIKKLVVISSKIRLQDKENLVFAGGIMAFVVFLQRGGGQENVFLSINRTKLVQNEGVGENW